MIIGLDRTCHACLIFTQWSKNKFFAPQGRHVAPINVKFGTGERTEVPNFTFIGGRHVAIQPPKLKISNFDHKFAPHGALVYENFYEILRFCTRL